VTETRKKKIKATKVKIRRKTRKTMEQAKARTKEKAREKAISTGQRILATWLLTPN
jgi:hypothetical protein